MITNSEHLASVRKLREFHKGDRVRVTWDDGSQDAGTVEKPEQVLGRLGFGVWLDKNDGDTAPSFAPVLYMEHLNNGS